MGAKRRSKGKYARSTQGGEKPGTKGMAGGEDSAGRGAATLASSVFREIPVEITESLGRDNELATVLTNVLANAFSRKEQLGALARIRAMFKDKNEQTVEFSVEQLQAAITYLTNGLLAPAPTALVPSITSTISVLVQQDESTLSTSLSNSLVELISKNGIEKAKSTNRLQEIGDTCLVFYTVLHWNVSNRTLIENFKVEQVLTAVQSLGKSLNEMYDKLNNSQGVEIMEMSNIAGRLLSTLQAYLMVPDVVQFFIDSNQTDPSFPILVEVMKLSCEWLGFENHPKDLYTRCAIVVILGTLRYYQLPAGDVSTSKAKGEEDVAMSTCAETEADGKLREIFGDWIAGATESFQEGDAFGKAQSSSSVKPTSTSFVTLPSPESLAKASPLMMLSLARAVLCHTSLPALFTTGKKDPLVIQLFRWIKAGCRSSDASTRVYGLQTMEVWASTVSEANKRGQITEALWNAHIEGAVSTDCMSIILDNWDHSMRSVTRLLGPVMEKVLVLLVNLYSRFSTEDAKNWRLKLLQRLLGPSQGGNWEEHRAEAAPTCGELRIASKGACVALGSVISLIGFEQVIQVVPDLVDQLIAAVEFTTVATAAVTVLTALLRLAHSADPDHVVALVMEPLAAHLTSPSSLHRKRVVEYVLPVTVPAYPSLVGPLLSVISLKAAGLGGAGRQSAVKELSPEERCLLGKLAVLAALRKHGFGVDFQDLGEDCAVAPPPAAPDVSQAAKEPQGEEAKAPGKSGRSKRRRKAMKEKEKVRFRVNAALVERACLSSHPDLQLSGLQLLLEAQTKAVLPSEVEFRVLKAVLPVALKAPTNEMRNNVTFQLRKLIDRFVVAIPGHQRKLQSIIRFEEATPEQATQIARLTRESQTAVEFLHWLQHEALSCLYPTSPFERAGTALELLLSIVSAFSKDLRQIAEAWRLGREAALVETAQEAPIESYGRRAFSEERTEAKADLLDAAMAGQLPPSFPLAPLFTEHSVVSLMNVMTSSYDRARTVAGNVLRQLPSPLPGFTTRSSLQRVVSWSLRLMGSAKIRESDAGALILALVRQKYVVELGWALDLPESLSPRWSAERVDGTAAAQVARKVDRARDIVCMFAASQLALQCAPSEGAYSVGAVVLDPDRRVSATGYSRECWGNTHAEEVALKKIGVRVRPGADTQDGPDQTIDNAHGGAAGCTLYTTMEPCSKRLSGNRTCTSRVLASGVRRVVVGVLEPKKFVQNCEGVRTLRDRGIQVDMIQDELVERACKSPNAFLFPEEALAPLAAADWRRLHTHQMQSLGMGLPTDLADLYFFRQLVGVFQARLARMRVAEGVDTASGVADSAVSNSRGLGSADEPSTLARAKSPLVVEASEAEGPLFVNGVLLALRYTWEQVAFQRYLHRPHATEETSVGDWRSLLRSLLSNVFAGLDLAMKVVGEVVPPSSDAASSEDEGSSPALSAVTESVPVAEEDASSQGDMDDPGEYLVKALTSGTSAAPKDLKVDCRGHLIVESGEVAEGQGEQLVVVGAWLLVKEGSNLLGALARSTPLSLQSKGEAEASDWVMSIQQVKHVGEWFLNTLLTLKHQGAISYAAIAFQVVCEEVLARAASQLDHAADPSGQDELLCRLPGRWLEMLLTRLAKKEQAFILRRSAGFAAAFLSIARSEPRNCPATLLVSMLENLLGLVSNGIGVGTAQDGPGSTPWRVVVHALNVIKLVFQDSTLAADLHKFLAQALRLAIHGFKSPVWAVRNSSMMVFAAILNRVVGSRRKNLQGLRTQFDGVTASQFFSSHPSLYTFLLDELTEGVAQGGQSGKMHPSLYPILLLMSRLSPGSLEKTKSYNLTQGEDAMPLAPFVEQVISCSAQINFAARQMAAMALASAVPAAQAPSVISRLGNQLIETVLVSPLHFNNVHGALLMLSHQVTNATSMQAEANTSGAAGVGGQLDLVLVNHVCLAASKLCSRKLKSPNVRVAAVQLLWDVFRFAQQLACASDPRLEHAAGALKLQIADYIGSEALDYFAPRDSTGNDWLLENADSVTANVYGTRLADCASYVCLAAPESPASWTVLGHMVAVDDAKVRLSALRQICSALKSGAAIHSAAALPEIATRLVQRTGAECQNGHAPYVVELVARLKLLRLLLQASSAPAQLAACLGLADQRVQDGLLATGDATNSPKLQGAVLRLLAAVWGALGEPALAAQVVRRVQRLATYATVAQLRVAVAKTLEESRLLSTEGGAPELRAQAWVAASRLLQDEDPEVRERVRHRVSQALMGGQGESSEPFQVLKAVFSSAGQPIAAGGLEISSTDAWFQFVSDGLGLPPYLAPEGKRPSQLAKELLQHGPDLGLFVTPVFEAEADNLFVEEAEIAKLCAFHGSGSAAGFKLQRKLGEEASTALAKCVADELSRTVSLLLGSRERVAWLGGITFHPQLFLGLLRLLVLAQVVVPEYEQVVSEESFQGAVKALKMMLDDVASLDGSFWSRWERTLEVLAHGLVEKCLK